MKMAMEQSALRHYAHCLSFSVEAATQPAGREIDKFYEKSGKTAIIRITGLLSNNVSIFDQLFGFAPSLTYSEIVEAIDQANSDEEIKDIILDINSPGGYVDGAELAALSIAASEKPVFAQTAGLMASAAYWLGSQAKKITALTRTATFGSIGVATVVYKQPGVFDIASTSAPNKRPDPESDDGMSAIRKELDDIHNIFAGDVARGRNVSREKVDSDFGKGGVFLAEEAKKAGMIDKMVVPGVAGQAGKSAINSTEVKKMEITLEKIKAENPDIATALKEEGIQAERKRVNALNSWRGMNADVDKIVDDAISAGKNFDDVMSSLQKAAIVGKTAAANGENPPDVPTATVQAEVLTAEEKEAAKLFGIPEAEFAKNKEAK